MASWVSYGDTSQTSFGLQLNSLVWPGVWDHGHYHGETIHESMHLSSEMHVTVFLVPNIDHEDVEVRWKEYRKGLLDESGRLAKEASETMDPPIETLNGYRKKKQKKNM